MLTQLWISAACGGLAPGQQNTGVSSMSPLMRRGLDVVIAIGLTVAAVFVIIVSNSFLISRGSSWQGLKLWYAFVLRPDILGMMVLTALVTVAYFAWAQGRRPRG